MSRAPRFALAAAAALFMAPAASAQTPLPPGFEESCPGVLRATPDLGLCFAPSAGSLSAELHWLMVADCALGKINEWQTAQLQCLESQVERVHRVVMYPDSLKKPMTELQRVLRAGTTLRQEIEGMACGWQFSPRTSILRDLFLKPLKLCKPTIQAVFGSHAGSYDADLQEYMDWTSTVSHNMVQERTVGMEPGVRGVASQGPEYSWMRIANETSQALASNIKTPGEAIRWAGVLSTDALQVANSTHQLRAQGATVEQQARDYRARKRRLERAFDLYLLDVATAGKRPSGGR